MAMVMTIIMVITVMTMMRILLKFVMSKQLQIYRQWKKKTLEKLHGFNGLVKYVQLLEKKM
ncbi:unnamed protein product [Gongylonema pulchrum]|uniref:Uncharacterized protein n=1 Tax=Gongylonema pulchrum TaxID=637853 RepID=A0A3P6QMZ8_9BILA|nr:unnamed protein product [Gongylonema pulchrum]